MHISTPARYEKERERRCSSLLGFPRHRQQHAGRRVADAGSPLVRPSSFTSSTTCSLPSSSRPCFGPSSRCPRTSTRSAVDVFLACCRRPRRPSSSRRTHVSTRSVVQQPSFIRALPPSSSPPVGDHPCGGPHGSDLADAGAPFCGSWEQSGASRSIEQ